MKANPLIKYILILLILPVYIFAGSVITVTKTDHQILYYAFNQDFDKGEKLINEMIDKYPDIPKYYFFKIITATFRIQAEAEDMDFEKRKEFRDKENEALSKYTEDTINRFKGITPTPENKYYLAYLYGYLGRMKGENGSYLAAFNNGKKSKGMLEELVRDNPDFYDAYLLLGMFEYYADRLGGVTEFVAGILGFSGSRNTGMKYMKLAYEKGDLAKPFAEFILGETYLFQESNPFTARYYFKKLVEKYPGNSSFYDWYVKILMDLHMYNEAEQAILSDASDFVSGYTKGSFYFEIGEYGTAHKIFEDVIKNKNAKWRSTYEHSKVLNAYCLMFMNKNVDVEKLGLDFYNKDQEKEWKEELRTTQKNIADAKKLQAFAEKVNTADTSGEEINTGSEIYPGINTMIASGYMYYSGVYFFKKQDYKKAENYFLNVADYGKRYSDRAAEFLIEIYRKTGAAKNQLDKLDDIVDDLNKDDLKFSFMGLKNNLTNKHTN